VGQLFDGVEHVVLIRFHYSIELHTPNLFVLAIDKFNRLSSFVFDIFPRQMHIH